MSSNNIRIHRGVPTPISFQGTDGTPIVIDIFTGIAYYLYKNIVFPLQFGPPSSVGAFSDGFSDGFS